MVATNTKMATDDKNFNNFPSNAISENTFKQYKAEKPFEKEETVILAECK